MNFLSERPAGIAVMVNEELSVEIQPANIRVAGAAEARGKARSAARHGQG